MRSLHREGIPSGVAAAALGPERGAHDATPRRPMGHVILRRVGWGVADQALSSLTNFALGILVARSVTPTDFGAFSVVFVTFTAALGCSRALTSEPLVVRYSGCTDAEWRCGTALATGVAFVTGVVLGCGCLLAARITGGALAWPFAALGVALPGLLVQDCWRYAFFARRQGARAFANDAVYAIVLALAFAVLLVAARPGVASLVLAWGGAGTVAAVAGVLQARVGPAALGPATWWRSHRDLIPRYLGEFAVSNGGAQLSVYGVGVVTGLATLGSLRAGFLLFGPLQVFFMGMGLVAVPEMIGLLRQAPRQLRFASATLSVVLAMTAVAWGAAVALTPEGLGTAVLGRMWHTARPLATAVTVSWIGTGVISGASAAMRALAAAKRGLIARVAGSLVTVAAAVAGAALYGARGAAWGGALAGLVEGAVWWWHLRRALALVPHVPPGTLRAAEPVLVERRVAAAAP